MIIIQFNINSRLFGFTQFSPNSKKTDSDRYKGVKFESILKHVKQYNIVVRSIRHIIFNTANNVLYFN